VTALAIQLALAVIPAILAITLHEAAHGYAALALGDDTAKLAGRLSLNPLRHIDRVGTILLPGILLLSQLLTLGRVIFMFGWAKPVPVSAWKFRNPLRMMALVAVAGPLMNFALALLGGLALGLMLRYGHSNTAYALLFCAYFVQANLILGLFNLIPIPPLDGGRIVIGILPRPLALRWAKLERYGILIVLLLLIGPSLVAEFGVHFDPLRDVLVPVLNSAYRVVLRVAGVPLDSPYDD
jgi:Zn-dependent protease